MNCTAEELASAILKDIKDEYEMSRRHCLKCAYWEHKVEVCGKYGQRPPLAVIVVGCPEYDNLPF